jgi:hypothetical protein
VGRRAQDPHLTEGERRGAPGPWVRHPLHRTEAGTGPNAVARRPCGTGTHISRVSPCVAAGPVPAWQSPLGADVPAPSRAGQSTQHQDHHARRHRADRGRGSSDGYRLDRAARDGAGTSASRGLCHAGTGPAATELSRGLGGIQLRIATALGPVPASMPCGDIGSSRPKVTPLRHYVSVMSSGSLSSISGRRRRLRPPHPTNLLTNAVGHCTVGCTVVLSEGLGQLGMGGPSWVSLTVGRLVSSAMPVTMALPAPPTATP